MHLYQTRFTQKNSTGYLEAENHFKGEQKLAKNHSKGAKNHSEGAKNHSEGAKKPLSGGQKPLREGQKPLQGGPMVRLIHHPEGQPGRRQGGPTEIESRAAHWKKTELGADKMPKTHTPIIRWTLKGSIVPNMHQIRNKRTDTFRAINDPSLCSRNGVTVCLGYVHIHSNIKGAFPFE